MKAFFSGAFLLLLFPHYLLSQITPYCQGGNGFVVDFLSYQEKIIGTGLFTNVCGQPAPYLLTIDTATGVLSSQMGIIPDEGHALELINGTPYIAMYNFATDSNYISLYNGTSWSRLGEGVYLTNPNVNQNRVCSMYDVIEFNGQVVACGEFDRVGNRSISGIMRWNGTHWDSLGSGLAGNIPNTAPQMYPHAMCLYNGDLIVAGNFLMAGDSVVNGVARWDGSTWHPMGEGFNSSVYGLGVHNGQLFAGGDFTASGAAALGAIARWDGQAWVNPGFEVSSASPQDYTFVHTIRSYGNELFLLGGFDQLSVGGGPVQPCGSILAYDGTQFDLFGGGTTYDLEAIEPFHGGFLLGGGSFGQSFLGTIRTNFTALEPAQPVPVLSPNPGHQGFRIQDLPGPGSYELLDMQGHHLQRGSFAGQDMHLDMSAYPTGIYLLRVTAMGQNWTWKWMKQP